MIKNSFLFLPKVGQKTEKNIWAQNIKNWDDFVKTGKVKGFSDKAKRACDRQIIKASIALRQGNSRFFTNWPANETWRLYEHFRDETVFLDIETTGVTKQDKLLMVGLYDGYDTKIMLKDINLDFVNLKKELGKYKLLITFNGAVFDLPFLERTHPGIIPQIPHIDLRQACCRIGLKGGLKNIEKSFNIKREKNISHLNGGDVYRLWRMAMASRDKYYLDLLIEYNEEDIINLKQIADYTVRKLTLLSNQQIL